MEKFFKNFNENEYSPKLAIFLTFAAIICLEVLI